MKKYFWTVPALYVAFEFGGKFFEVVSDNTEITGIIATIKPIASIAGHLSYMMGTFDLLVAISLLTFSCFAITKKYHKYVFIWTILWPFIPASFRYFGGVGDFEVAQVLSISVSALVAYILHRKYNYCCYKNI